MGEGQTVGAPEAIKGHVRDPGAHLASLRVLPASREVIPGQEDTRLRPQSPELVPPLAVIRGRQCSWLGFFKPFLQKPACGPASAGCRVQAQLSLCHCLCSWCPPWTLGNSTVSRGCPAPPPSPLVQESWVEPTQSQRPPSEPISFLLILSFPHEPF